MDKEYIILNTISNNSSVTQRELSKLTGLSLGSINILLAKMVKEGLIKIRQIPMNRALYMLTPKGMAEKVSKTRNYIKVHYNYINETKQKIIAVLLDIFMVDKELCILLGDDEISELIKSALNQLTDISYVFDENSLEINKTIIVANTDSYNELIQKGYKVINLLERI